MHAPPGTSPLDHTPATKPPSYGSVAGASLSLGPKPNRVQRSCLLPVGGNPKLTGKGVDQTADSL